MRKWLTNLNKIFMLLQLVGAYAVSALATPVYVLTRWHCGRNMYGRLSLKGIGKGKDEYIASPLDFSILLLLLFIFTRLCYAASIVVDTAMFDVNQWGSYGLLLWSLVTHKPIGAGMVDMFYYLFLLVLLVGVAKYVYEQDILRFNERPPITSRGNSLLSWLEAKRLSRSDKMPNTLFSKVAIHGVWEPVLIAITGVLFISFDQTTIGAFAIAMGIAVAVSEHSIRTRNGRDLDETKQAIQDRDTTRKELDEITVILNTRDDEYDEAV